MKTTAALTLNEELLDGLSDVEIVALAYDADVWLRPEQRILDYPWRYWGFICGRGWGKTWSIGSEINRRVESGEVRSIGLMAPTKERVAQVQFAALIESAPPWFRPEVYLGDLVWPNGALARAFSPEAPGRPRSENLGLSWLTEIVDWQASGRREAFDNITTATRVGRAQVIWDTTSKGRNDVIDHLLDNHARDAWRYPLVRGELFDNPMLSETYVRSECEKYAGRRLLEEIFGRVFQGSQGALWEQEWIDAHRVQLRPELETVIVGVDPALSDHSTADDVGIVVAGRDKDGHAYVLDDFSARMSPDVWGETVIRECLRNNAAGVAIERNHVGDHAEYVLRTSARERGLVVRRLPRDGSPFPRRTPGVIYVREYVASTSKVTRAGGPAAATKLGKVHVVGNLPDLETEWTSYAPGVARSPNRYDASVYALIEILSLGSEYTEAERRAAVTDATAASRSHFVGVRGRGRIGF